MFQIVQLYAQALYIEYEHVVNVVKEIGSFKSNAVIYEGSAMDYNAQISSFRC